MTELMEMLCKHCPELKYLHVDGHMSARPIEEISTRNPIQQGCFQDKDQFQNLKSIQINYHGMEFLQGTKFNVKYFKDYLIAKCPKITEITIELDIPPNHNYFNGNDFLYYISISICSVPCTNFFLRESRLVEQVVTPK